jgi:hypothetical protein
MLSFSVGTVVFHVPLLLFSVFFQVDRRMFNTTFLNWLTRRAAKEGVETTRSKHTKTKDAAEEEKEKEEGNGKTEKAEQALKILDDAIAIPEQVFAFPFFCLTS